jgi:hypothetical protein
VHPLRRSSASRAYFSQVHARLHRSDHNTIANTGGHGGVQLPEHESGSNSIDRLIHPQQR